MPWRSYSTVCQNPDCLIDETFTKEEVTIGELTTCECGAPAVRIPQPLVAIGILVEYHDLQSGRVFNSNAAYKDYLRQGQPILNEEGEVVGTKEMREFSHDELDRQKLAIRERQEVSARKSGMSWATWKAETAGRTAEFWKARDTL